jgi:hypothetical protein
MQPHACTTAATAAVLARSVKISSRFRALRNTVAAFICLAVIRIMPRRLSANVFPDGVLDGTSITSLAQLASHLSCCRHRQAVDEFDITRILVGGETIAHEGLNFAC